jgi:excisionase family DNA binding protein
MPAALLRLNPQTIRNMIDRRELGAVRLGQRRVRVRRSQLDEFLAAGERPAKAVLHQGEDEGGPWQAVRAALEAAIRAANTEDAGQLARALADLSETRTLLRTRGTRVGNTSNLCQARRRQTSRFTGD